MSYFFDNDSKKEDILLDGVPTTLLSGLEKFARKIRHSGSYIIIWLTPKIKKAVTELGLKPHFTSIFGVFKQISIKGKKKSLSLPKSSIF